MILHYFPTPNGHKVTIALEEMALAYDLSIVDILKGEQLDPTFLAICPNGRIPALVDGDVTIFESAAILQYLGRKSGLFYSADEPKRTQVDSWLFWQMAGLGPMQGQLNYFRRAAAKPDRDPRDTSYAIHRYEKEVARLYGVLERQLAGRDFMCGDYSLADMACWPWVDKYGELTCYPAIAAWRDRVAERPAVQRAMEVGRHALA